MSSAIDRRQLLTSGAAVGLGVSGEVAAGSTLQTINRNQWNNISNDAAQLFNFTVMLMTSDRRYNGITVQHLQDWLARHTDASASKSAEIWAFYNNNSKLRLGLAHSVEPDGGSGWIYRIGPTGIHRSRNDKWRKKQVVKNKIYPRFYDRMKAAQGSGKVQKWLLHNEPRARTVGTISFTIPTTVPLFRYIRRTSGLKITLDNGDLVVDSR